MIATYAGKDATDVFACFHAATTWSQLRQFYVGDLVVSLARLDKAATSCTCNLALSHLSTQSDSLLLQDAEPASPLLTDFRALRSQMQRQGLFKCRKGYYVFKILSNFALLAAAIGMFTLYCDRIWAYMVSAFLISLFWQQSGWLAHDFLHHQVFKSRRANHIFGLLIGDICLVSYAANSNRSLHECFCTTGSDTVLSVMTEVLAER